MLGNVGLPVSLADADNDSPTMAEQLTKEDRLLHMRHVIIPFHVRGVMAGLSALDLGAKHDLFTPVEIHIEGPNPEVQRETLLRKVCTTCFQSADLFHVGRIGRRVCQQVDRPAFEAR